MNDEAEISISEVRKCLKEADSFDPSLSEPEMRELYQVLKDSQKTATEEDEQRRIFEQTEANCSIINEMQKNSSHFEEDPLQTSDKEEATEEFENVVCSSSSKEDTKVESNIKRFTPKTWSHQKKQVKPLPDLDDDDEVSSTSTPLKEFEVAHIEEEHINVADDIVDVFNSVPTTHKPLEVISRNPKYSPPPYCNPKLAHLDCKERARLIAKYHLELLEKYHNYQRQSPFPAPWGKPIQSTLHFNGSLMKNITNKDEENTDSSQENHELYETTREEMYVSKSGRQTKRKLYTENVNSNDSEWKRKSKSTVDEEEGDTKKIHPKKRRMGSYSKEEIMKRSKLFGDNANLSRSETMFEKLKEEGKNKIESEKEIEKFKQTLDCGSDDDFVDNSVNIADLVHADEPYIRRRVVPPSRAKKATGKSKTITERPKGKRSTGNKKSASDNSSQESISQKYEPLDVARSTNNGRSEQKASCPVCYEEFFQSELAEHTPACLDTNNQNSKPLGFGATTITCENCDTVFALDMNYEEHVKGCLINRMK